MSFDDLGLSPAVLQAVADAGYTEPTPIQEQAIPIVLMGRDVLGCAQTGTGKTASFTLPMIEILAAGRARARMPRSLIITPTRELATQIAESFTVYGKHHKLTQALLIGGVSFTEQNAKLDRGVDVLIATPGRLLDHFEHGRILLTDIKVLVIDEADRMMDMGFIPDVERIVGLLPRIRQTLFFSATIPPEIRRIADQFLINPKEISVTPNVAAAENVSQGLAVVDEGMKREALRRLLRSEDVTNALIFCNRKKDVDILCRSLKKHGFNAAALHGDMSQPARLETLETFKRGDVPLLVASDVAARGLDLPRVSHVFNFDVPTHREDYVHRIGRTGRAGRSGTAFTLATPEESYFLAAVVQFIGNEIPRIEIEGIAQEELEDGAPRRRGRRRAPPATRARAGGEERKQASNRSRQRPRRGHREARPDAKEAGTKEPGAKEAGATAGKPPESKPQESKPRESKPPERKKKQEAVLGMGAHVPAFMRRPVKAAADPE